MMASSCPGIFCLLAEAAIDWPKIVPVLIGAGLSAFVSLFLWFLNRKRPNRVVCRESAPFSLVRTADKIRPRVHVTYDGTPVEKLAQLEVKIYNQGSDDLSNIKLRFSFPERTRLLAFTVSPTRGGYEQAEDGRVELALSHLNAHKGHRDEIIVAALCDGDVRGTKIEGSGQGWSVKHVAYEANEQAADVGFRILLVAMSLTSTILACIAFYNCQSPEAAWGTHQMINALLAAMTAATSIAAGLFLMRKVQRLNRVRTSSARS